MANTTFATTTKAGKVILWIVGIILALVVVVGAAGLLTFSAATRDNMPVPTVSPTDMKDFAIGAAKEVVTENKITVEPADIDTVLAKVKDSVNGSTDLFEVRDLFSSLEGNKGTIYARVYVDTVNVKGLELKINKVLPVQVDFGVEFDSPCIVIILDQFKCGSITIPQSIIDSVLGSVALPEEMYVKNGNIYYDTSNLDSMIDGILEASITDAINNSGIISFLGNLFGQDAASSIASQAASTITGVATNATNVELNNAYIEDGKLIIEGKVF